MNPSQPRDRIASEHGFGWLLGVAGDRALVTSGWSGGAIDIYRLRAGGAPQFDQTVRANGWGVNSVSRQNQTLFCRPACGACRGSRCSDGGGGAARRGGGSLAAA